MVKAINKLFNVDKKVLLFLFIISIIGIITGSLFMAILSSNDKEMINISISNFISSIEALNVKISLTNNLIINFIYAFIIWIIGISIIGIPITILIIFYKSFLVSFTLSSFIFNYGYKGIILGIIYNFPHQIINLLVYIYLGVYSIKLSTYILKGIIYKKSINFKLVTKKYILIFVICTLLLIISSLYESILMPKLLYKAINML